ncbi:NUMOD3 domain-containing DNA-binding protein [Butyricimonas paravirosa]
MNNEIKYDLDNSSREKMRQKKLGSNNPNFGKPRTPATKEKIAQSQRKSWEKRKIGKNSETSDGYLGDIQFNTKEEAVDFFEELNRKHVKTIIISQEKFEALLNFLIEKTLSKTL